MALICDRCGNKELDDDTYVCTCQEGIHPKPGCQDCYVLNDAMMEACRGRDVAENTYRHIWRRYQRFIKIAKQIGVYDQIMAEMPSAYQTMQDVGGGLDNWY